MGAPRIMRSSLRSEANHLASSDSRGMIAACYRISPVTVSRIFNKTCLEIWNSRLQEGYIAPPEPPED